MTKAKVGWTNDPFVHATARTPTYGINVVKKLHRDGKTTSHINIFKDGVPSECITVDGSVDIGSALITVGTHLKLEEK